MSIKYPRTFHLPWSPGATNDDKILQSTECFVGEQVIVSIKMDGECSSLYPDKVHARSLDSNDHPSRHWLKAFHASICHDIPKGWRICGENMFAQHSISYYDLLSYFLGFSVWSESNICLSWENTLLTFSVLGITPVEVIYEGIWHRDSVQEIHHALPNGAEGYVVRNAGSFYYGDFAKNVAKFVRKEHVQTDAHWMHQKIIPNKLR